MATRKQKEAFKKVVKGSNLTNAMKAVGYADSTSKRTNKLTKAKGWQELITKYIPDKDLIKVHKEGLGATTKKPHLIDRDDKGRPIYDYIPEEDFSVRHKYLDTAYKLKGKYAPEKFEGEVKNYLTPEQIEELFKNKFGK